MEPSDPQQKIEEVAEQYLDALQAGEVTDRSRYTQAHPELGSSLDRRLALVERVFHAARALDTPLMTEPSEADEGRAGPATTPAPLMDDGGGPPLTERDQIAERATRLRCPHCGNHIQLVVPDAHEITCRNCGSTFQVDVEPTASFRPARLPKKIGKFEVLELLGRGGFGTVFKARDTELRRTVAVKVPRSGYFVTQEEEQRFFREARNTARLKHPGIVQIHEIARERGVPYIVSDYVEGLTLADRLTGPRSSFRETAVLLEHIAVALEHAHQQKIIHRDIKPSNILIDSAGDPHITDFGLARRDEGEITVTLDGQILGTPAYMSPEQAMGAHDRVDGRSDLYSLGVVMYRMLTGELPFTGSKRMLLQQVLHDEPRPPRRLNDRIPRDLETICLKAMAKAPVHRYASARALAADLHRWLVGEPVHARPVGRPEHLWRWARRNPLVAVLSASIAALLIVTALGASWSAWHENVLRGIAETARGNEAVQRERAETNAAESNRRLVRLHTHQGIERIEAEDLFGSLVWFAAALDLDSADPERENTHRIRLATTLRRCPKLAQLCFHEDRVVHAEFSPDGDLLVTASLDGTAQVWRTGSAGPPSATMQHAAAVFVATFSLDGLRVATASEDHTARIWNVATGRPIAPALEHTKAVRHVKFSRDGRLVATASDDRTARIWDSMTGAPVTPPLVHPTALTGIAFSPDATRLVSGCGADGRGEVRMWNTESGELIGSLDKRPDRIWSVEFSSDGTRLLTASDNGSANLWNADSLQPIGSALHHDAMVQIASFSADGSRIVTASKDSSARVWNGSTGQPVTSPLKHEAAVSHASFSPDGRYLATASGDGTARVWDASNGNLVTTLLRHAGPVVHVAFSPDGRYLATSSFDHTTRVWDLASGHNLIPPLRHDDVVRRAFFTPSGDRIATASSDGTVRIWDPSTAELRGVLRHPLAVLDATLAPGGQQIATACLDRAARLWDINTGTLSHPPMRHDALVKNVAFSGDGRMLVSSSEDGTARVWRVDTGQLQTTVRHAAAVNRAAFDNTGRRFATASSDFTVRVWDVETGAPAITAMSHDREVWHVSFSPDGKYLASAAADHTVRIWDAASGTLLASLSHSAATPSARFSHDSNRIVTVSLDGSARVWDVASGQIILPPLRHTTPFVDFAVFSVNGKLLATTAGDRPASDEAGLPRGEMRLWDATTAELLAPPVRHRGRVIRASFDPDARRVATASYDGSARVWDIAPDVRPAADWQMLAELLAGHRIDEAGGFVPLPLPALREYWSLLHGKYAASFASSDAEVTAWLRNEVENCEQAGDWKNAINVLNRLIVERPNDKTLFGVRARAWAELDNWDNALTDFTIAAEAEPEREILWCDHALVTLASGDVPAFQRACTQLIERFSARVTASTTTLVARVCTLLSDAVEDKTAPLRLAQEAVDKEATEQDPGSNEFLHVLAATLYRSNQFDSAISRLNQAMQRGGTVADWLLLAMALHQIGRGDEAQQWFGKAAAVLNEPAENQPRSSLTWQNRLVQRLLYREAESLMTPPPGS